MLRSLVGTFCLFGLLAHCFGEDPSGSCSNTQADVHDPDGSCVHDEPDQQALLQTRRGQSTEDLAELSSDGSDFFHHRRRRCPLHHQHTTQAPTKAPTQQPVQLPTTSAYPTPGTKPPTEAPPEPTTTAPMSTEAPPEPTTAYPTPTTAYPTPTMHPTRAPPEPTLAPVIPTLAPPLPQSLWPRMGLTHQRCPGTSSGDHVDNMTACQAEAEKLGHHFYSFKPDIAQVPIVEPRPGASLRGMCVTASDCSKPVPTEENWQIFEVPPPGHSYCFAFHQTNTGDQAVPWAVVKDLGWEDASKQFKALGAANKGIIIDMTTSIEQLRTVNEGFQWKDIVDIRKRCGIWNQTSLLPEQAVTCSGEGPDNHPVLQTQNMTEADYDDIVGRIGFAYSKLPQTCDTRTCPRGEFAGCALRMAGHDFMDYKDGTGGSDACSDMEAADNAGLAECLFSGETYGGLVITLADIYKWYCHRISLADFLVVAAEGVMNILRPPGAQAIDFKSNFQWGRTTAISCPGAGAHLPDAEKGCSEVERIFINNMKLTEREAAALMGVHTIGRTRLENSGYDGWWSDPTNSRIFNNNYYISMVTKGWIPKQTTMNKHQWDRADVGRALPNHEMMLNTDLCLAFIENNPVTGAIEPLNAAIHDCCAWLDPPSNNPGFGLTDHPQITQANGGLHCGDQPVNIGFESRFKCCDAVGRNAGNQNIDCGTPFKQFGFAVNDVLDFASNEDVWLLFFKGAWGKATTNGLSGLHPLTAR